MEKFRIDNEIDELEEIIERVKKDPAKYLTHKVEGFEVEIPVSMILSQLEEAKKEAVERLKLCLQD